MVSRVIPVDPFDLVVFGGTGDLARRKILPGLYRRFRDGQIPETAQIIGAARSDMDAAAYRKQVAAALGEFLPARLLDKTRVQAFLDRIAYVKIDATGTGGWTDLKGKMRTGHVQVFYFSVAPGLFGGIAERLHKYKIAREGARIVAEKPFGNDLETARALNETLARYFGEHQIYRIDHYLGKETVQNLMAVRFGNMLFEPLWKNQYIDHVQITVAETVGVGGRGTYYDKSGAMRDMVQNHLMQLLCLTAMEPPSRFEPDAVRDEKLKVIRALEPVREGDIVRGQYLAGEVGGEATPSYLADVENAASLTESFVAMKVHVANWRWNGTPFYLRTGKRMKSRLSEIVVRFKEPPHSIFDEDTGQSANELRIRLQPNEGMDLSVTIKEPGPGGMRLMNVPLDMTFAEALGEEATDVPDAYERLIMDVIRGNQTLFMRGDEVEAAWAWTDPIISSWEAREARPAEYETGSTGPEEALILMHRDGRRWRELEA
ncbi:MAG TPA: glucose-6-phosphate dehydrogenase [Rhodobacteraceae bacterium]|nr:glucose-6-phosphate dehydrogenase [Paracoccaceae bacterium]